MERNKNEITITESESKICKLDGKKFESSKKMMGYVKKAYPEINSFEDYIIEAYYDGSRPVCLKTGKELTFKAHKLGPWFKNYTTNAFPRKKHTDETKKKIKVGCEKKSIEKYGVKNVFQSNWFKEEYKKKCLEKYGVDNVAKHPDTKKKALDTFWQTIKHKGGVKTSKESSYEIDFKNKLETANIKFESPFLIEGRKYDFYISDLKLVVEIDGEAYHKDTLENLTFQTINTSLNDYSKDIIAGNAGYELKRIRYDKELFEFFDLVSLLEKISDFEYKRDYSVNFNQKICYKEYFEKYKEVKGSDKLESYSRLLLRFTRKFIPDFPKIPTDENLHDLIEKINEYDVSSILHGDTFRNNCSMIGVSYLKSHFKSYWNTRYKQNRYSPVASWDDDDLMLRIIKYRMGVNDSGEVFDFSPHQIIRGMSAIRLTASFFKPILATSIYCELLGDKKSPTVIDPCCGFGGRLLGFKSKYPNGTYIGCEPNKETYDELSKFVGDANFSNVELRNCKWEDFKIPHKYDLTFTSIPYFNLEIYSNHIEYESFDDWKNTFFNKFYEPDNCYINMDMATCEKLNLNNNVAYKLKTGKSHFSLCEKFEVICKL
jgi:very-short-patch-repair endonuclease